MNNKTKSIVFGVIAIVGAIGFQIINTTIQKNESKDWPEVEAKIIDTMSDTEPCGEDKECDICRVTIEYTLDNNKLTSDVKADSDSFCNYSYKGKYLKVKVNPKENAFGSHKVYVFDWDTYEK